MARKLKNSINNFGIRWECAKCKKKKVVVTTNSIVAMADHAKTKCTHEELRLFVVDLATLEGV